MPRLGVAESGPYFHDRWTQMDFFRFAAFTGGTAAHVYNRRHQIGLVYVDSDIVKDRVVGRTLIGDLVRGEIVDMPEVV